MNSQVSFLSAAAATVVAFFAGVAWEFFRQAFADLRAEKAKIKNLRKTAWGSIGRMIKTVAAVAVLMLCLGAWVFRDAADEGRTPLVPSPSPEQVNATKKPR